VTIKNVSRLRIWPFNKAQGGIPATSMGRLDRAGISSRKTITKIILMMCNGWNSFKNFALPVACSRLLKAEEERKGEKERKRERERNRERMSDPVIARQFRSSMKGGPLSIGWLLRRPLLISGPLVLYCSPYFSPPLFLFRVLLANLTISSSISCRISSFFYFDSSSIFLFSSNRSHLKKLTRRWMGYDTIKWRHYQKNIYICILN